MRNSYPCRRTQFRPRAPRSRMGAAGLAGDAVVHMDVPEIEVMWPDIPDPLTPMGARGVGEIAITGTAAAVAAAICND